MYIRWIVPMFCIIHYIHSLDILTYMEKKNRTRKCQCVLVLTVIHGINWAFKLWLVKSDGIKVEEERNVFAVLYTAVRNGRCIQSEHKKNIVRMSHIPWSCHNISSCTCHIHATIAFSGAPLHLICYCTIYVSNNTFLGKNSV